MKTMPATSSMTIPIPGVPHMLTSTRKSFALQFGQFLSLLAMLLIAGQLVYIYFQGAAFCLNSGCKVVENLTRVSPMVFNVAGLAFFLIVYVGLHLAHGDRKGVSPFITCLLLGALAAEAVLVGFQYFVVHTFCSYCLGIFAFVLMLNLLMGLRQIAGGAMLFIAVGLAFASLNLGTEMPGEQAFTQGVAASRPGKEATPVHYLFFSATCPHCEKVIASLNENQLPTMMFNPIDAMTPIKVAQLQPRQRYNTQLNMGLLKALGIKEVPVLVTPTASGMEIVKGDTAILKALSLKPAPSEQAPGASYSLPLPGNQEGCSTETSSRTAIPCTDVAPGNPASR